MGFVQVLTLETLFDPSGQLRFSEGGASVNWILALAVGAIILVGACAVTVGMGIKTGVDTLDSLNRSICYEEGYYAGAYRLEESPPTDYGAVCREVYSDAYGDGWSGNYDPPE